MRDASKVEVRRLEDEELDALLSLYVHLHDADDPLPPRSVVEGVWHAIQNDPNVKCFGLFFEGTLVASCILSVVANLTRGCRPYALIENVVTHSDYRRQGLGKALLAHVLEHAWGRNCYKAMLQTGRTDEGLYRFYESAGFDRHAKQAFLAKPPVR